MVVVTSLEYGAQNVHLNDKVSPDGSRRTPLYSSGVISNVKALLVSTSTTEKDPK